jgi:hypothetical protein
MIAQRVKLPTLREQFSNDFASSAFKTIDGEARIVGKFGQITQFDDRVFDVWFVGSSLAPLGYRKLAAIENNIGEEGRLRKLNGEACIQGQGRDFVLRMASLAGIKKKRRLSEAARQASRERLQRMRVTT